jgi:hypothetical protein
MTSSPASTSPDATIDCSDPVAKLLASANQAAAQRSFIEGLNTRANVITAAVTKNIPREQWPSIPENCIAFLGRQWAYLEHKNGSEAHKRQLLLDYVGSVYDTWTAFFIQQKQDEHHENEHRPTKP